MANPIFNPGTLFVPTIERPAHDKTPAVINELNIGHAAVMPAGTSIGRPLREHFAEYPSVKDFRATGDNIRDDTQAFKDALASGYKNISIPPGLYRITDTLFIPNGTTLIGAGKKASMIWAALPGGATLLQAGPTDAAARGIQLRDFGIIGGASPGGNAINVYGMLQCKIDLYISGGWDRMFRSDQGTGFTGLEESDLALEHIHADNTLPVDSSTVPDPKYGVYIKGYANSSHLNIRIGTIQAGGDGVYIEGTYANANDSSIEGSIQGVVNGWALRLVGQGMLTHVHDLHCEGNANDIRIENHNSLRIDAVYGAVTLVNSSSHSEQTSYRSIAPNGQVGLSLPQGARLSFNGYPGSGGGDKYLYYDGSYLSASHTLATDDGYQFSSGNGTYTVRGSGTSLHLKGWAADGAGAVGTRISNIGALSTAGARALSVYADNETTEAFAVRKNANTWGVRLQSPDGTWYLLTIANGGVVNIAAD